MSDQHPDRFEREHILIGIIGERMSHFLLRHYIPKDSIILKVNKKIIDDSEYILNEKDYIVLNMVRAYQLPEFCKTLGLWEDKQKKSSDNSIYTKNIFWSNDNGIWENREYKFNKQEFISWIDSTFVVGINSKNLIKDGDNICLALSGGRDSLALLYLLSRNRKNLPQFNLYGVTVGATVADESDIERAKEAIRNFNLKNYSLLNTEYVNNTFNFSNGFGQAIDHILSVKGRGYSIFAWHCVMRANVERFCRENGIGTIAYGYHHEDLLASLWRTYMQGISFGESVFKKKWGEFEVISPLWSITKKELTLYLNFIAPDSHSKQGPPTNYDQGDHNRDINYFISDTLSAIHPGVGFSLFEAQAIFQENYSPKMPQFYQCKNCGTYYSDLNIPSDAIVIKNYCNACMLFMEYNEIPKVQQIFTNYA